MPWAVPAAPGRFHPALRTVLDFMRLPQEVTQKLP